MTAQRGWLVWGFAAIALATATVGLVYLPMQQQVRVLNDEHASVTGQIHEAQARIASVPVLEVQIDSVNRKLAVVAGEFASNHRLSDYVGQIRELGRDAGLSKVVAEPRLPDLLRLPAAKKDAGETLVRLDSMIVALEGTGEFRGIGHWLEAVESRPGFRRWTECRWTKSEGTREVEFTGSAVFRVAFYGGDPQ